MGRKPTFEQAGVATVAFSRGESFPITKTEGKRQVKAIASGGAVKVNTLSTNKEIFYDFPFNDLTQDDIDNVITFFDDVLVNWAAIPFVYRDTESNTVSVRLWNENISQTQNYDDRFGTAFTLREET